MLDFFCFAHLFFFLNYLSFFVVLCPLTKELQDYTRLHWKREMCVCSCVFIFVAVIEGGTGVVG